MKKFKLSKLMDDPRIVALLSLFTAVLIWCAVTLYVQPGTQKTFHNIPINFNYETSSYTALGLDIVNQPTGTVSVKITGDGSVLGDIKSSDYVVYPDYTTVRTAGEARLNLNIKIINPQLENRVTIELASGQKSTVNVVFDTVETKEFAVSLETYDLKMADGFVLNKTVSAPSVVTVSGPQSEIEQIDRVVALVEVPEEIRNSQSVEVPLQPVNKDNEEVELNYAELSSTKAEVQLSVYQLAELPLKVEFINTPPGFDESALPYALSQKTMTIAGPANIVSGLTELSVGYFDLSTFALNKDFQLAVNLPNGIISQENTTSVTMSFDSSHLAQKTLNVNNIHVINVPANYQIEVQAKNISGVTLIGPEEEINDLAAGSVVAQINAEDIQVAVGQQNVAVQIYAPSSPHIFAVGNYTVQCGITSK